MATVSLPASRLPALAAFAVFCGCLCYWSIQLSLPAPQVVPEAPPAMVDHDQQAADLLGPAGDAALDSHFKLIGIAALAQGAAAIISQDDAPASAVALGSELGQGVKVAEITARTVILQQGRQRISLSLPASTSSAATVLR